jgi:hypothetical protein
VSTLSSNISSVARTNTETDVKASLLGRVELLGELPDVQEGVQTSAPAQFVTWELADFISERS